MEIRYQPETRSLPKSQAHKLETPKHLAMYLGESAVSVASSEMDEREQRLIVYMQSVKNLMDKFGISLSDVKEKRQSKAREAGLFKERKIQEVPHKGHKLVRDKRPGVPLEKAQRREYLDFLNKKLIEETKELTEVIGRQKRIEELADVYEVSELIMSEYGFDNKLIERKRQAHETNLWMKKRRENSQPRRKLISKRIIKKQNVKVL